MNCSSLCHFSEITPRSQKAPWHVTFLVTPCRIPPNKKAALCRKHHSSIFSTISKTDRTHHVSLLLAINIDCHSPIHQAEFLLCINSPSTCQKHCCSVKHPSQPCPFWLPASYKEQIKFHMLFVFTLWCSSRRHAGGLVLWCPPPCRTLSHERFAVFHPPFIS